MAETVVIEGKKVQLDAKLAPGNIVVLTVTCSSALHMQPGLADLLAKAFLKVYRDALDAFTLTSASCVVVIQSDKGSSALARAFIYLYEEVVEVKGCKLAVAGYPEKYLDDITTLGFTQLDEFYIVADESEALRLVQ